MRYLGGKCRFGKHIVPIVLEHGDVWWDPFCGGLGVAARLAKMRRGYISDAFVPLMHMYAMLRAGWDPPSVVTKEDYKTVKDLPDTDPRKAFLGFGCSFRGIWMAGYDGMSGPGQPVLSGPRAGRIQMRPPAAVVTRRVLLRDIQITRYCDFQCIDFLTVQPRPWPGLVIYADPPYAGTQGYPWVGQFDHALFWRRVEQWERCGVPVLVSELTCPVPHTIVFERDKPNDMKKRTYYPWETFEVQKERLFRVRL